MDRIVEVKVFGNHLIKDSKNAGTKGEANVTRLRITFDESWDGYAKDIVFWDAYGENAVRIMLTTERLEDLTKNTRVYLVPIPAEAMARAGLLTFTIKGALNGKKQVSITSKMEVKDSPDILEPIDPTPTQVEQLQSEIEAIKGDIQGVAIAHKETTERAAIAKESADRAEATVGKASYIGENGNWYAWDVKKSEFYDTGIKAQAGSTVYCGANPPEEADVWIDPDGDADVYTDDFANAIKVTARGERVHITDISPVRHNVSIKVRSKNVIERASYYNSDEFYGELLHATMSLEKGKTYTLSVDTPNTGAKVNFAMHGVTLSGEKTKVLDGTRIVFTFVANADSTGEPFIVFEANGTNTVATGLLSNAMVEEGEVATEYKPYVADVTNVLVEVGDSNGRLEEIVPPSGNTQIWSSYPDMTIANVSGYDGIVLDVTYNKDMNKAIKELDDKITEAKESIALVDRATNKTYKLFVEDGNLRMEVVE